MYALINFSRHVFFHSFVPSFTHASTQTLQIWCMRYHNTLFSQMQLSYATKQLGAKHCDDAPSSANCHIPAALATGTYLVCGVCAHITLCPSKGNVDTPGCVHLSQGCSLFSPLSDCRIVLTIMNDFGNDHGQTIIGRMEPCLKSTGCIVVVCQRCGPVTALPNLTIP